MSDTGDAVFMSSDDEESHQREMRLLDENRRPHRAMDRDESQRRAALYRQRQAAGGAGFAGLMPTPSNVDGEGSSAEGQRPEPVSSPRHLKAVAALQKRPSMFRARRDQQRKEQEQQEAELKNVSGKSPPQNNKLPPSNRSSGTIGVEDDYLYSPPGAAAAANRKVEVPPLQPATSSSGFGRSVVGVDNDDGEDDEEEEEYYYEQYQPTPTGPRNGAGGSRNSGGSSVFEDEEAERHCRYDDEGEEGDDDNEERYYGHNDDDQYQNPAGAFPSRGFGNSSGTVAARPADDRSSYQRRETTEEAALRMLQTMQDQCDHTVRVLHGKTKTLKEDKEELKSHCVKLDRQNTQLRTAVLDAQETALKVQEQSQSLLEQQERRIAVLQERLQETERRLAREIDQQTAIASSSPRTDATPRNPNSYSARGRSPVISHGGGVESATSPPQPGSMLNRRMASTSARLPHRQLTPVRADPAGGESTPPGNPLHSQHKPDVQTRNKKENSPKRRPISPIPNRKQPTPTTAVASKTQTKGASTAKKPATGVGAKPTTPSEVRAHTPTSRKTAPKTTATPEVSKVATATKTTPRKPVAKVTPVVVSPPTAQRPSATKAAPKKAGAPTTSASSARKNISGNRGATPPSQGTHQLAGGTMGAAAVAMKPLPIDSAVFGGRSPAGTAAANGKTTGASSRSAHPTSTRSISTAASTPSGNNSNGGKKLGSLFTPSPSVEVSAATTAFRSFTPDSDHDDTEGHEDLHASANSSSESRPDEDYDDRHGEANTTAWAQHASQNGALGPRHHEDPTRLLAQDEERDAKTNEAFDAVERELHGLGGQKKNKKKRKERD